MLPKTRVSGRLKPGDIITDLNGKAVHDVQQLRNAIAHMMLNTDVNMKVFRDGKSEDVVVHVAKQPEDVMASLDGKNQNGESAHSEVATEKLGIKLQDVTDDPAQKFDLGDVKEAGAGDVGVAEVGGDCAGLQMGDVITQVGKQKVTNAKDVGDGAGNADLNKGIQLYITDHDGSHFIYLKERGGGMIWAF